MMVKVWEEGEMLEEWNKALQNKGTKEDCNNFREIALLDVTHKAVARTIKNRLEKYHNEEVSGIPDLITSVKSINGKKMSAALRELRSTTNRRRLVKITIRT